MKVYIPNISEGLARNLRLVLRWSGNYELTKNQSDADKVLTLTNASVRVFGKWCEPLDTISDEELADLAYVDDIMGAILSALESDMSDIVIEPIYHKTGKEIRALWASFRHEHETLDVANQEDPFAKRLYATYVASLPLDGLAYDLVTHADERGMFTEVLHTSDRGQVSVIVSKRGKSRGQHWHHTKIEKFLVVSGEGEIAMRPADEVNAQVIRYRLSSSRPQVVRIPPGYVHRIDNLGDEDMVTLIWTNEIFDPKNPDTFREEV